MTDVQPDTTTGTIEHLDFTPQIECEHGAHPHRAYGHHGPAWALIQAHMPCCGRGGQLYICRAGYEYAGQHPGGCSRCRVLYSRDEIWTVIGNV